MAQKKKGGTVSCRNSKEHIAWHPAFYAAVEFDFRENRADLTYDTEHQLSKEPLKMDLLVIKKKKNAIIKNEIGHFFREFNILEYKGPDAALNISHLYKALCYACLYKFQEPKIAVEEITVSLVREAYPRKLFAELKDLGVTICKTAPGIYTVKEKLMLFSIQIVVIKELVPKDHQGMRILSKKLQLDDLENFLKAAKNAKEPEDRNNISAILNASGRANQDLFQQAMEVMTMPEFFEELLKDRIEAREAKSRAEGEAKGRAEGEAKGRAEGKAEGRDYCAELMGILLKAGRIDDALRAVSDKVYLDQLIDEMVVKNKQQPE